MGINPAANLEEVKQAYRKLALLWHPDRNPGNPLAESRFKDLLEAYQTLSDPSRRASYDQRGHKPPTRKPSSANRGPAHKQPQRETRARRKAHADPHREVDEIFADISDETFLKAKKAAATPKKGDDLRYSITISFREAIFGTEKEINFPVRRACTSCKGSGAKRGSKVKACPTCFGRGLVTNGDGERECEICLGIGVLAVESCPLCRGKGSFRHRHRLTIAIPPGCETGTRLRIPGEGGPGIFGGPPGDLYAIITAKEHPLFYRQGFDIVCDLPLTFGQAALGALLEAPTLEGAKTVHIKPGTQNGEVITLREQGVPKGKKRGERGNHIFIVSIETPKRLSSKQRELLSQFDEIETAQSETMAARFWQKVKKLLD
jgi:molecular chaperone DnaJ